MSASDINLERVCQLDIADWRWKSGRGLPHSTTRLCWPGNGIFQASRVDHVFDARYAGRHSRSATVSTSARFATPLKHHAKT